MASGIPPAKKSRLVATAEELIGGRLLEGDIEEEEAPFPKTASLLSSPPATAATLSAHGSASAAPTTATQSVTAGGGGSNLSQK